MDRTKLAIAAAIALVVVGVLVVVLTRTPDPEVTADAGRKLPIELGWNDAEAYLGRIGYPIVRGEAKLLVARDSFCATDAECRTRKPKIIFHYAHAGDTAGPYCVTVTHSYPLEWRSIVQKLTGEDAAALPPVDRDYVQVLRTGIKLTVSVDATKLGVGAGCL